MGYYSVILYDIVWYSVIVIKSVFKPRFDANHAILFSSGIIQLTQCPFSSSWTII